MCFQRFPLAIHLVLLYLSYLAYLSYLTHLAYLARLAYSTNLAYLVNVAYLASLAYLAYPTDLTYLAYLAPKIPNKMVETKESAQKIVKIQVRVPLGYFFPNFLQCGMTPLTISMLKCVS